MEAASDPLEGSVRQKAATASPVGERTGLREILLTIKVVSLPCYPQAVPCDTRSHSHFLPLDLLRLPYQMPLWGGIFLSGPLCQRARCL